MTAAAARWSATGLVGPVAFWGGCALLALSPLVRGGNRYFALVPLELLAVLVLAAIALRISEDRPPAATNLRVVLALACAPFVIAAVQLLPLLPGALWLNLPGRADYADVLELTGGASDWRALSVAPRATAAALLAGLPLAAALLLGYCSTLEQLRALVRVVAAVAFLQAGLAALQLGGQGGFLMFEAQSTAPVGTFGNRNHYASYVATALCCWLWLAWGKRREDTVAANLLVPFAWDRNAANLALAIVLVLALLVSRSRAAVVFGLAIALFCVALSRLVRRDTAHFWRWVPAGATVLLVALIFIVGADALTVRFTSEDMGDAAGFRAILARSSLEAAAAFFPFGSGWGTYDLVYPRFQPTGVAKFVNHAHMDFIELLVEGGILFLAFAAAFAWAAARRARQLWRIIAHGHRASREAIAAAFCGAALLVPLMHSVVEFNLRIPAIAVLASLLAGAYLRPLPAHPVRP